MKQIFSLLFQRLMRSKTVKYVRSLLVFFAVYIVRNSPDDFYELVQSIQNKWVSFVSNRFFVVRLSEDKKFLVFSMFVMVVEKLIIADLQKVLGKMERKICSVGYSKLLTSCATMFDENNSQLWYVLRDSTQYYIHSRFVLNSSSFFILKCAKLGRHCWKRWLVCLSCLKTKQFQKKSILLKLKTLRVSKEN